MNSRITWCFADGTRRDLLDQKGKEASSVPEAPRSIERPDSSKCNPPLLDTNLTKEAGSVPVENEQDRNCSVSRGKAEIEVTREDAIESHASARRETHDSSIRESYSCDHEDDLGNHRQRKGISSAVMTPFEQSMLEDSGPSVDGFTNDIANAPIPTSSFTNEGVPQRQEDTISHAQTPVDCTNLGKSYPDKKYPSFPLKDKWKPASGMSGQNYPAMPVKDSNVTVRNFYQG